MRSARRLVAFLAGVLLGTAIVLVLMACRAADALAPGRALFSTTSSVTWRATCGTVTASGFWTPPVSGPGPCLVIAAAGSRADTARVDLVAADVVTTGVPFGPFALFTAGLSATDVQFATFGFDPYTAANIVGRIAAARRAGVHVVLAMTGGKHTNYLTNGVFDPAKWGARLATFDTDSIRTAIAQGVADGTVLGASVMDEPNVCGGGDGNTWGPCGTMTKVRVDSLCGAVKQRFPTLPAGVTHRWDVFQPDRSYRVCDFLATQYSSRIGSVTAWRDGALALGARDHHAILFSINVLNGGTQDTDGTWDCAGTGGMGTYSPNCRMTAAQIEVFGLALGPSGCAFGMWQYDATFFGVSANQAAFRAVADSLARVPVTRCVRR